MTSWATLGDVKASLLREWKKGFFLRAFLQEDELFPKRVSFKHPSGIELSECFVEVKAWISLLHNDLQAKRLTGLRLECNEISNRVVGRNQVPVALIIENLSTLLKFIKCESLFDKFKTACKTVFPMFNCWHAWFVANPFVVIDNTENWARFMSVTSWLRVHPRPEIYLRQLDLSGIDTKFIEKNKTVLSELLDIALPEGDIDRRFKGSSAFEQRYGFKVKPILVRFRILDSNMMISGFSDFQVRVEEFSRLNLPLKKVFITENEINGLAFPDVGGAIVIFGLGYGLDRLAAVDWLKNVDIYYWGDIDTHGFAMLDQLRSYFPRVRSILMDKSTLLAHKAFWGNEPKQVSRELPRLNYSERALYLELLEQTFAPSLRLEQERISFGLLRHVLINS